MINDFSRLEDPRSAKTARADEEFDLGENWRARNAKNAEEHGLPFDLVADFDFEAAVVAQDTPEAYGEDRLIAVGLVAERLHVVATR